MVFKTHSSLSAISPLILSIFLLIYNCCSLLTQQTVITSGPPASLSCIYWCFIFVTIDFLFTVCHISTYSSHLSFSSQICVLIFFPRLMSHIFSLSNHVILHISLIETTVLILLSPLSCSTIIVLKALHLQRNIEFSDSHIYFCRF